MASVLVPSEAAGVYEMTWYCGDESVTVPLRDLTPDGLLDAAANADLDYSLFSDTFLMRLLYALTYQVLTHGAAEVDVDGVGELEVRRAH